MQAQNNCQSFLSGVETGFVSIKSKQSKSSQGGAIMLMVLGLLYAASSAGSPCLGLQVMWAKALCRLVCSLVGSCHSATWSNKPKSFLWCLVLHKRRGIKVPSGWLLCHSFVAVCYKYPWCLDSDPPTYKQAKVSPPSPHPFSDNFTVEDTGSFLCVMLVGSFHTPIVRA